MSQLRVGIRELKAQLSSHIRQVKAGATVVITERGRPVGRIVPLSPSVDARLGELIEAGVVAWSGHKLSPVAPMTQTRGNRMVADLLLENRE